MELSGADILRNWHITEMNCVGFGRRRFWHIQLSRTSPGFNSLPDALFWSWDFNWLPAELTILFT